MKKQYRLTKAFHPSKFEKGIFVVRFHEVGQLKLDRFTKQFVVRAKTRSEAIKKARAKL